MVHAIFTHSSGSIYDDLPEERYHFPQTYFNAVSQTVGDWIIYYEPRRLGAGSEKSGGNQSYFAIARVTSVDEDPTQPGFYYARISDFIPFSSSVRFKEGEQYFEAKLRRADGKTNRGAFGRSVRPITRAEFESICAAGFVGIRENLGEQDWIGSQDIGDSIHGLNETSVDFERPIVERITNRPFRDAAFARLVKSAYEETCALTGLKILNGGGRPEVEAAHIKPVSLNGPDALRNGLALCRTAHWMFDRGIVSISDDYRILVNEKKAPTSALKLLTSERRLILPKAAEARPHPTYLLHHRLHHGFD